MLRADQAGGGVCVQEPVETERRIEYIAVILDLLLPYICLYLICTAFRPYRHCLRTKCNKLYLPHGVSFDLDQFITV